VTARVQPLPEEGDDRGSDADLAIVDLELEQVVTSEFCHSAL